ncbi:MAG: hypothetical protein GY870_19805 [archaeon]|nr:hypothetical protein [archaeon]
MDNNNIFEENSEEEEEEEDIEIDDDVLLSAVDNIADNLMDSLPLSQGSGGDSSEKEVNIEEKVEEISQEVVPEEVKTKEKTEVIAESEKHIKTDEIKAEITPEEMNEEILKNKNIIMGHTIPNEPSWHLKRNKTGFTLPKEVREKISDDQNFALIVKENELHFYMINEEDIPKLNLIKKPKSKEGRGTKKGGRKRRKLVKEPEGPQPEWGKYFLFQFEDSDKVQDVLETAFEQFASTPPDLEEGMKRIKYALTSFMKSSRMNDSRVRQTIIFFLLDVVDKFKQPNLIDFIKDKIIMDVKSRFLYQLSLNQLAYTTFKMHRYEKAQEFITMCLEDIAKYGESEMYAIMDSFKNLIIKLTREVDFLIPQEQMIPIKDSLNAYFNQMDDNDYKIQLVDLLDRMHFIDEAVDKAKQIYDSLPEESQTREEVKDIIKNLESKPI